MKYALVIVQDPSKAANVDTQALRNFAGTVLGEAGQIPQDAMLNPGAFLLPLSSGLTGLSNLVAEARDRKLRTYTLFLDEKPTFVITEPRPSA